MFRSIVIFVSLFIIWQAMVTLCKLPPYILPSPSQVLLTLINQSSVIAENAITTIIETLIGFLLGTVFGFTAGLLITFFSPLALFFFPLLIVSQAIPTFAIAPLFVIWFGYGLMSKIAIAILMIFFPVTSAFYDGVRRTPQGFLDLAHTMNATKWRIFSKIHIPAALPALASGIRIAAVVAPIGAIVGEWVGSSHGLGYLMLNANARMQIDMMFAALIVTIILALLLYFSVDKLLRMVIW